MKTKGTVYTFDRVIHLGITLAVLWGIVWLLGYLSDVLIPFAVALLLAYLINPLVNWIQKKIRSRVSAVLISLFLIVVLLVLAGWLIFPVILTEISNMGKTLSELVSNSDLSAKVGALLPADIWAAIRDWAGSQGVQDFFRTDNFWQVGEKILTKILPGTWNVISGAASILMSLIGLA
ncbi:MAG: AI-2E family transporter, partial [FCB group bacterium]|nr:AI-2E family transporter [FCB group bacterium]